MSSQSTETLDATGIRVSVNHIGECGSLVYTLPLGGGRIDEMDSHQLVIEVEPAVEIPRDRWRSYDAIERLAAKVEKNGGYMHCGDAIHVGDEILVGRDAFDLLEHLNRRATARERGKLDEESYRQGYEDALRDAKAKIEKIS